MKLSIIIPAYNVEQYLERCVDSCEYQDINKVDYEIIIINDGSNDNTLQIASSLAQRYDNILVFSQKNSGSSVARNYGLSLSKGEYIWFIDSDDYIEKNCIGNILTIMEKDDIEICHFSLDRIHANGKKETTNRFSPANTTIKGRDAILIDSGAVICSACANIYKKSFLQKYNLHFTVGITQQDVELNGRAFAVAERCMFINNEIYNYSYNPKSICNNPSIEKRMKYAGDTVRVAALHRDFYNSQCKDEELKSFLIRNTNTRIAAGIRDMIKKKTDRRIIDEFVNVAREKEMYPVYGPMSSKVWNLLRPVVNSPSMWWIFKIV